MMGEILLSPDFPAHELERVRREHLTDLRRSKDEPNVVAERLMSGLVYPAARAATPIPIAGTEASAQAVARDDILGLFRRDYRPDNAHLVIAGDVDREEVMRRAEAVFGSWSGSAASAAASEGGELARNPTTIYLVDRPGAPQSVIRAVHPSIPAPPSRLLRPVADQLRLWRPVLGAGSTRTCGRTRGYSYGYQSHVQWYRGPSALVAGGSVQSNATKESVYETLKEFNEVRGDRPITAEELANAKDGILRAYPASFERPASVLGQLVSIEQFGLPGDYFRTVRPSLEAITLDQVHRVAQAHILPGNLQILVVGDRATTEAPLSELALPIVHLTVDGEPAA